MYGLLAKYLADACTPEERDSVEAWITDSDANAALFEQVAMVWHEAGQVHHEAPSINIDTAWKKQLQLRRQAAPAVHRLKPRRLLAIAAAIVVLLAAAVIVKLTIQQPGKPQIVMQYLQSTTDTAMITLADGSSIVLNKQSTLSYPTEFTDSIRKVSLQGEAFFSVAANTAQPFVIEANGVTIRVVGTAFNVKTTAGKTEVIVEEGKVLVQKKKQAIALIKGEKTTVYDTTAALQIDRSNNALHQYYRSKVFVCDNTPLPDLISVLNEAYGVQIVLGKASLADLRITTTFNDASLDDILNIIALTFELRLSRQSNKIVLE